MVGFGIVALLSLVWQQQATMATYYDVENAGASFKAATLEAIAPKATETQASRITLAWDEADGDWATPQYTLDWAATENGAATNVYTGPWVDSKTHTRGSGAQSAASLLFTDVAAGTTHACGVARGEVYCWGTNTNGLGNGTTTNPTPVRIFGGNLAGKTVTAVTAGNNFTCAIADGKAVCWGNGANGRLGTGSTTSQPLPKAVTATTMTGTVTSISAGDSHACAVAGGLAYCWGSPQNGRLGNGQTGTGSVTAPVAVATASTNLAGRTVSSISAGYQHSCAVADARAYCWGYNNSGRLGDGTATTAPTAVPVVASGVLLGRTVTAISAGQQHSCALADGAAYCWGLGTNGRLGNGSTANSSIPVLVSGGRTTYTTISAGLSGSCAVAAGTAYCWGASTALGNGATVDASAPVTVTGTTTGRTLTAISVGGAAFACGTGNTPAACWGDGAGYRLGDGSNQSNSVPADVSLAENACPNGSVRLSDGGCSLKQDTDYWYTLDYEIGAWAAPASQATKATTEKRTASSPSVDSRTATSITVKWGAADEKEAAYPEYTLERATDADGSNAATVAVTGSQSATDRGGVAPGRSFTQVSSGLGHTCGILGKQLYCWGLNADGQLGLGDATERTRPTLVTAFATKTVTAVSAGGYHTCAIADGRASCWGQNDYGQIGNGASGTDIRSPLEIPYQSTYGVTATAVSAGFQHTCAIGTISGVSTAYCWGLGTSGQLGNSASTTQLSPVAVTTTTGLAGKTLSAISAGSYHSCIVAGGAAYCWGQGNNGKLGTGNTSTINYPAAVVATGVLAGKTVAAISAGEQHTCAIANSLAYCWGNDASGQLGNNTALASSNTPVAVYTSGVLSGKTVTAISSGQSHTCAAAADAAYCWGENGSSQLGNGGTGDSAVPVSPTLAGALSGAKVVDVGAGWTHSCTIAGGDSYCWGVGTNGRLGQGTTTSSTTPVASVSEARCAAGAAPLGDGSCTLAPGTDYWYRVTYTLDGNTRTAGTWTKLTTG